MPPVVSAARPSEAAADKVAGRATATAVASRTPARRHSPESPSISRRTPPVVAMGAGGTGGIATAGSGGNGATGGTGGMATGGTGGDAGFSSFGVGGGIYNGNNTTLVINPRLHARKGSSQAKATNVITSNQAVAAAGGAPGAGGSATAGTGGSPNGANGSATHGATGAAHPLSIGAGGGIFTIETAMIDFTMITGNFASSLDSDVDGTIST